MTTALPFAETREQFAALWPLMPAVNNIKSICQQIREVIIIASSSRGGSSFFAELMRHHPHLLHFSAEINPFFVLNGLSYPASGTHSDALDESHLPYASGLEHYFAWDIGNFATHFADDQAQYQFALDIYGRLLLQWPHLAFKPALIVQWVLETLRFLQTAHQWPPNAFLNLQLFHALFFSRLVQVYPEVNPYYYDLNPDLIRQYCPQVPLPKGPPHEHLLEEVPFVTASPWRRPKNYDAPLVIKTPSNVYRLPFIRALFPNAKMRIMHLTRNPIASVNGLYEGWHHHGFFSHKLPVPLQIEGYTDQYPAWAHQWWNFDLPPGWEQVTRSSLVKVCGFQWRMAHTSILEYIELHPEVDYFRLPFEALIRDKDSRRQALEEITQWLGVDPQGFNGVAEHGLPPIMTTGRPRHRRWTTRAELYAPIFDDERTQQMTEALGYGTNSTDWI